MAAVLIFAMAEGMAPVPELVFSIGTALCGACVLSEKRSE